MKKNSVILYDKFFEATKDLEPIQIAEIWRAILCYIKGEDYNFQDAGAKASFAFMKVQLEEDKAKYAESCAKKAISGKSGGLKRALKSKRTLANASECLEVLGTSSECLEDLANQADNDNDNDINKEKNILKKEISLDGESEAPTLEYVIGLAGMPDIGLSPEEATEFYDYYSAQGWRRGNGLEIVDIASQLRTWKRNKGKFDTPPAKPPNGFSTDLSVKDFKYCFMWKNNYLDGSLEPSYYDNKVLDFCKTADLEDLKMIYPRLYEEVLTQFKEEFSPMAKSLRQHKKNIKKD